MLIINYYYLHISILYTDNSTGETLKFSTRQFIHISFQNMSEIKLIAISVLRVSFIFPCEQLSDVTLYRQFTFGNLENWKFHGHLENWKFHGNCLQ